MKFRSWIQLCFIAIVVFVLVSFIRSCDADPTQGQLFSTLSVMRTDMDEVEQAGGLVISYDNNDKTTFARVYLLLTVDAVGQSQELSEKYKDVLVSRDWTLVNGASGRFELCKQGASASVLVSQDRERVAVGMTFDAASISKCREHRRSEMGGSAA
jgi:hypothetical protein